MDISVRSSCPFRTSDLLRPSNLTTLHVGCEVFSDIILTKKPKLRTKLRIYFSIILSHLLLRNYTLQILPCHMVFALISYWDCDSTNLNI
jgi:hypothetical protein